MVNLMIKLESGKRIDNGNFEDIVRYENKLIDDTTVKNSNVGSPIFFKCNLKNVTFEKCDLNNARFFSNCTIENCKFTNSDLRAVGIAKGEAIFINCEFNACDMRGMTIENAIFRDCTFAKCKFNDRVLNVSQIDNCTFSGKLLDITFQGSGKSTFNANLEESILDGVIFDGCDLTQCIPPKHKTHIYISDLSTRLRHAVLRVNESENLSADDKKIMLRFFKNLDSMEQYIFNVSNIKKNHGDNFTGLLFNFLGLDEIKV